jgi:succinate-semialdehyde dehydrogenase / glutarate-semialdehyde dehydrogenase
MQAIESTRSDPLTTHACWIDGRSVGGDQDYPLVDPSTGEVFARATLAGEDLVDSALASAERSYKTWRATSTSFRVAILSKFAALIREGAETLASTLSQEVGKPIRAARAEVLSAAQLIDYFAQETLRVTGQIPYLGYAREQVMVVREPVGVVAAINPFNYPLSTLICKVAPAIAVGCTVVAKPDEHTPITTLKLAQMAIAAGLPPGVFNVLTGDGPRTGRLLVEHPTPRLIAFTGSTEVGKEIHKISAKYVRKVVSELGGHCPAIVCADACWPSLLPAMVAQSFKNCGQYCYRISRIYVAERIYSDFLDQFARLTMELQVGPAFDPNSDLGPMNNPEAYARLQRQVETAVSEGAHVHIGGAPLDKYPGGFYYLPTILTNVTPGMKISRQEVFGPVVIITPFSDPDSAIKEANDSPYGLGAYLFTADLARALEWSGILEAGSIWVNAIHQAYPEAPFGGMKESGLGREKSRFGVEEYTELKTIYFSY